MNTKMNFVNKVVLITGASSGIGAATAIQFAKEGAQLAIVGRNETNLQNVAEEIEKIGKKPLIIQADLSKDEDLKTIIKRTVDTYGKLDVLVNNAGRGSIGCILDGKLVDVFDPIMELNLRAPVILTTLAAPHLIETKGNIVNISSVLGTIVSEIPHNIAYSVSKAGLEHFTRCAALELAPSGVRVNCVKPGPVQTNILENSGVSADMQTPVWEIYKSKTALNRIAEPEEIADLVIFLASEKAKSITGSSFVSDNGASIKS